uniref:PX domain-containing protein kinase-like protein n=1 Tax=Lygus hesperus TaxID=30085 RepID=A0A0A9WWP1_LYGHE
MSIFEKQSSSKFTVDDSCQLKAVIINSETNNGHTEYVIRVHRGFDCENSWHVHRRYNDFLALHKELSVAGVSLPLPPKKMIGNMDREFILQRLDGLQSYLNIVLNNAILANQKAVKIFLEPHTYSSVKELGITQMSLKLRGETDLKVVKQLPHIGRRLRKEYYLVQSNLSLEEFILTWTPFGPDKYLDQRKISTVMKSFCGLQHANIAPPTKAGVGVDGVWVLRPSRKSGTLLDMIYDVKAPLAQPAIKKYANYSLRRPMDSNEIIHIVSQILGALEFLHSKGTFHGHLHLGNIFYEDGAVHLVDYENQILGVPPYYREQIMKSRQIKSICDVDVYCLGLIIYELLYRKEYDICDQKELSCCPTTLRPLLDAILVEDGIKNGLPEITHLLSLEIFRNGPQVLSSRLKMSDSCRQDVALNGNKTFERLKIDHLKFRKHNRTSKLHEMLSEDNGKFVLLYDSKKACSKSSSCSDSDHPRSEVSDGVEPSRTPTPSVISEGTAVSEENLTIGPAVVDGRTALLGAITGFDKKHLKKVTNSIR